MNSFDLVVYAGLVAAMVIGFRAGLLRSVATIAGYLIATPIAVWITALVLPPAADAGIATQNSLVFFGVFLIAGILLGSALRMAVDDMVGTDIGIADRLAGAVLGAARVGLIAVTLVLIFDQMLPANLQPRYMTESRLRPWLLQAGQRGVNALPPDVTAYIDRWKREHRL